MTATAERRSGGCPWTFGRLVQDWDVTLSWHDLTTFPLVDECMHLVAVCVIVWSFCICKNALRIDIGASTIINMEVTFDLAKDALTKRLRDVSLAYAERFDWDSFRYEVDTRRDYGETRYRGFGYIDGRLFMCACTLRDDALRVISLRKANPREVKDYEQS